MVHDLSVGTSLVHQYIAELRDVEIQKDRLRFRRNLGRIAGIAAYEISKGMEWAEIEVQTPLATTTCKVLKAHPVIANILRAGAPMHAGLLDYFDRADNAFITAYRKHDEQGHFEIELEYVTSPDITGRFLIVADPMLATGASMAFTLKELIKIGQPKAIHIVCAIAARPGIDRIRKELPQAHIWAGAIDEELNSQSFIVPGLGDAGDLAFGEKIQS